MMWIVRLALRRPISVAVMALLMLVLGTLSFFLMKSTFSRRSTCRW